MTETRMQHFLDWPTSEVDRANSGKIRRHERHERNLQACAA